MIRGRFELQTYSHCDVRKETVQQLHNELSAIQRK